MAFTPTDYKPYDFANRRHIGPSPSEMAEMFEVLGVKDLDELIIGLFHIRHCCVADNIWFRRR